MMMYSLCVISAAINAKGAHCVNAQESPRTPISHVDIILDVVAAVVSKMTVLRRCERAQARGKVKLLMRRDARKWFLRS